MSGLHLPIKPFPQVAAISKGASKLSVKAGGGNKLKSIPPVAAVNQVVLVKPVKGGEQKAIAASSSRKKAIDPGNVIVEKNRAKKFM